jgi:hypothetical protein
VNVTVVGLEEAVEAYKEFDNGAAKASSLSPTSLPLSCSLLVLVELSARVQKFVLDPHGIVRAHLAKGRPAMQSSQMPIGAGRM